MKNFLMATALMAGLLGSTALHAEQDDWGNVLAIALGLSVGDDDRYDRQQVNHYRQYDQGRYYQRPVRQRYYNQPSRHHHPQGNAHGYWRKHQHNSSCHHAQPRNRHDNRRDRDHHDRDRRDGNWEWDSRRGRWERDDD